MAASMVLIPWKTMNYSRIVSASPLYSKRRTKNTIATTLNCSSPQQESLAEQQQVESGIMCEPCSGKGWVLCDFCGGQKTNVKADNKRIYRRCPSCRAIGYVLCVKCKVFKCVTFPNYSDSETSSL